MTYYKKHLFFCTNQKATGKKCCATHDALTMATHAKTQLSAAGLHGPEQIRISTTGCLGRCEQGPCVVVYPDGLWYTYENEADVDSIIQAQIDSHDSASHLLIDKRSD